MSLKGEGVAEFDIISSIGPLTTNITIGVTVSNVSEVLLVALLGRGEVVQPGVEESQARLRASFQVEQ